MATSKQTSPLRNVPLYQPAARVFGPSSADQLLGEFRRARDYVPGWLRLEADAIAKLARAELDNTKWREQSVARAQESLDGVRAGMSVNTDSLEAARAALLALGVADPV